MTSRQFKEDMIVVIYKFREIVLFFDSFYALTSYY